MKMTVRKKLLFTARDPATANDFTGVLPGLIANSEFEIYILAQEPAYRMLKVSLARRKLLTLVQLEKIKEADHAVIKKELDHLVQTFDPHVLISGISGPNYGIDEIALDYCNKIGGIRTFSIQSYWGDINLSLNSPAQTVFVLDHFAAEITNSRYPEIKTIITGSFQKDKYNLFDCTGARQQFRERNRILDSQRVIAFFGQPLFEFTWYRDVLNQFSAAIASEFSDVKIVYKPHPKESPESVEWFVNQLSDSRLQYRLADKDDPLMVLAGTDLAVSLFSSIGYDLQNLLLNSTTAFSMPMYLFYEPGCREWYREYCRLDKIPMTGDGMAIVVNQYDELCSNIYIGLSNSAKVSCQEALQRNIYFNNLGPCNISRILGRV